ncbi:four helix bundle protein [Ferrimonas aestuarii]|nr:four helix bundle protein [Ferrimonas aestuarii]
MHSQGLLAVWERSCRLVIAIHNHIVDDIRSDMGERLSSSVIAISCNLAKSYDVSPPCKRSATIAYGQLFELSAYINLAANYLPLCPTEIKQWQTEISDIQKQLEAIIAQLQDLDDQREMVINC